MQNIKELDMFIDDKMREDAIRFGDWILGNVYIGVGYYEVNNGELDFCWESPICNKLTTKDLYEMYLSSK